MADFTELDLLEEISAIVGDDVPERPPGCVDKVQMASYWGVTIWAARNRLDKAVMAGNLETMLVRDPHRDNQTIRVWRKVTNE